MKHRHTITILATLLLAGSASAAELIEVGTYYGSDNSPNQIKYVAGSAKITTIEGKRTAGARFVSSTGIGINNVVFTVSVSECRAGAGYTDMYNVNSRTPSYLGNHAFTFGDNSLGGDAAHWACVLSGAIGTPKRQPSASEKAVGKAF